MFIVLEAIFNYYVGAGVMSKIRRLATFFFFVLDSIRNDVGM